MSPASLAAILGGGFFLAAAIIAGYLDWQRKREDEAARHALAYYDTWADADLIRDTDGVVLHNQPTKEVC